MKTWELGFNSELPLSKTGHAFVLGGKFCGEVWQFEDGFPEVVTKISEPVFNFPQLGNEHERVAIENRYQVERISFPDGDMVFYIPEGDSFLHWVTRSLVSRAWFMGSEEKKS